MDASRSEAWDWGSRYRWPSYIGIPDNIQEVSGIVNLKHWTTRASQCVKGMWCPLSRWGGNLGISVGSLQGIQTSFHLLIWKRSLHLSFCKEIQPSFESGHLGVLFTWSRKHRVPLRYIFQRENSSWDAGGNLAYLFIRWQEIISHLHTKWCA